MADSKKSKESAMSMEAFRAKKAGAGSSGSTKTIGNPSSKPSKGDTTGSTTQDSRSRPQTTSKKAPRSRSASVDNIHKSAIGIEVRQDKVKQLRNKQVEDRKKKNEERRIAFEERRKQKQEEEKQRWENLKQQAAMMRPGSGRKLPTLPDPRRPATAGANQSRPKSLKTTTASKVPGHGTAKNPTKSPAQSSSSLSSDSSPKQSPTTPSKNSLGVSQIGSSSDINSENRRASTSNLSRSTTASKNRPSSIHGVEPKMTTSKSHSTLTPASRTVKKAQSTSALHHIGIDRPPHLPKKHAAKHDKQEKPKAGMQGEAAAKLALAERRKQAREEAERKAKLDLERQEEERKRKEEEDIRLAEEMAKEEERIKELADLLKHQEKERLEKAIEEKEQRDKEEAERLAAEEIQKEEDRKIREEEERIAKIEAEKKAKEDEERRKQEDKERQERRKRVEEIMSRTRQKTSSPNPESLEASITPPQDVKELDVEDTKRKVSEILQKVKDRSDGLESASSVSSLDSESSAAIDADHSTQQTECEGTIENDQRTGDDDQSMEHNSIENPKPIQEITGVAAGNDSVIKVRVRISETRTEVKVNGREVQRTLSREHVSRNEQYNESNGNKEETGADIPSIVVGSTDNSHGNQDGSSISEAMNGHDTRGITDVAG